MKFYFGGLLKIFCLLVSPIFVINGNLLLRSCLLDQNQKNLNFWEATGSATTFKQNSGIPLISPHIVIPYMLNLGDMVAIIRWLFIHFQTFYLRFSIHYNDLWQVLGGAGEECPPLGERRRGLVHGTRPPQACHGPNLRTEGEVANIGMCRIFDWPDDPAF